MNIQSSLDQFIFSGNMKNGSNTTEEEGDKVEGEVEGGVMKLIGMGR